MYFFKLAYLIKTKGDTFLERCHLWVDLEITFLQEM